MHDLEDNYFILSKKLRDILILKSLRDKKIILLNRFLEENIKQKIEGYLSD